MPEASAEVQQAYNEWAHQYDTNANLTRDLNAKVLRQQPFDLAGKWVLEIGCGTGFNTIWLANRAQFVVGVDIAAGMLRKACRRLGALNVDVLQADITKPWPLEQTFDVVATCLAPATLACCSLVAPKVEPSAVASRRGAARVLDGAADRLACRSPWPSAAAPPG